MKFVKMEIPYVFAILTCSPIFLLVFLTPLNADTQLFQLIETVIDQYLFGKVGMWSSAFPLASKIVTNYWCLVMPVFSVIFAYRTLKLSTCERVLYEDHSVIKLILLVPALIVLLVFFFYISYVGNTDLASAGRRYSILGKNKLTYALFVSAGLCSAYLIVVVSYIVGRYFPSVILARMRAIK
ncbi:hypothetical protein [Pseudomonas sp. PB3P13]